MEQSSTVKNHNLTMHNRSKTTLTGVTDVIEFDLCKVILETTMGVIHIKGKDIKVTAINLDKGEVSINGEVDSFEYTEIKSFTKKGKSVLNRMLK